MSSINASKRASPRLRIARAMVNWLDLQSQHLHNQRVSFLGGFLSLAGVQRKKKKKPKKKKQNHVPPPKKNTTKHTSSTIFQDQNPPGFQTPTHSPWIGDRIAPGLQDRMISELGLTKLLVLGHRNGSCGARKKVRTSAENREPRNKTPPKNRSS